ncbi:MAG: tRNA dimethylallyltransferase, partial [Bacillota bacterium]
RAIETILSTGELPSQIKNGLCYNAVVLAIEYPREQLYCRINHRVDQMVANGLFEEVSSLLQQDLTPEAQALQGIGYKEIVEFFSGKCSKNEAIEKIKINTRHFAKRQLTWYKKMPYIQWITATSLDDSEILYKTAANLIADKFNLQISTRSGNESYSG